MTRPRLQVHLSTLLIVSLLAAGLVLLNVRERLIPSFRPARLSLRGWPCDALKAVQFLVDSAYDPTLIVEPKTTVFWTPVLVDVIACLGLLAVAAVAIEWATRRMKRKAP
jgi:hypothetical protein